MSTRLARKNIQSRPPKYAFAITEAERNALREEVEKGLYVKMLSILNKSVQDWNDKSPLEFRKTMFEKILASYRNKNQDIATAEKNTKKYINGIIKAVKRIPEIRDKFPGFLEDDMKIDTSLLNIANNDEIKARALQLSLSEPSEPLQPPIPSKLSEPPKPSKTSKTSKTSEAPTQIQLEKRLVELYRQMHELLSEDPSEEDLETYGKLEEEVAVLGTELRKYVQNIDTSDELETYITQKYPNGAEKPVTAPKVVPIKVVEEEDLFDSLAKVQPTAQVIQQAVDAMQSVKSADQMLSDAELQAWSEQLAKCFFPNVRI